MMRLRFSLLAALLLSAAAPAAAQTDRAGGTPVDEGYRASFGQCDRSDTFQGHRVHGCRNDPNAVTTLTRRTDGTIAYRSKLAVDLDGSPFACSAAHGAMDQCPTSLMLPSGNGGEVPVDADTIPYVVIPFAGPHDVRGRFTALTGIAVGDFGYVRYRGVEVPVIVADTGPFEKLGEGSIALHRALGRELCAVREHHVCTRMVEPMESIDGDVLTVLYPGSRRTGLTPATIAATIRREVARLRAG